MGFSSLQTASPLQKPMLLQFLNLHWW